MTKFGAGSTGDQVRFSPRLMRRFASEYRPSIKAQFWGSQVARGHDLSGKVACITGMLQLHVHMCGREEISKTLTAKTVVNKGEACRYQLINEPTESNEPCAGGNSGLGAETARVLAAQGCRVIITARSLDAGKAVASDIRASGAKATFSPSNICLEAFNPRAIFSLRASMLSYLRARLYPSESRLYSGLYTACITITL